MCVDTERWDVFSLYEMCGFVCTSERERERVGCFVCFPTSIRNWGVLVQSHQRRVEQHRVHVFCDHTVVGSLYPRLVLVDCEEEGRKREKPL